VPKLVLEGVTDKLDGVYATVPVKEREDKELDPDDNAAHGGEGVLEPETFNVTASMKVVESPIRSFVKVNLAKYTCKVREQY
jgi:hypothetical protein